jgi:Tol biopolymer transport system component
MKYPFYLLLILCLISCTTKHSDPYVLESTTIAVFIESRSYSHGISSGRFGDVVLIDIGSGSKYFLTKDSYYNTKPTISYDRSYVAFFSNRVGSRLELKIKGIGDPHEIYIYDLNELKLERFGEKISVEYPNTMRGVHQMKWKPTNDAIYFVNYDNTIFEIHITEDTLNVLTRIEEDIRIGNISPSNDGEYIAFSTSDRMYTNNEMLVLDLGTKKLTKLFKSDYPLETGSWLDDGSFLYRDGFDIFEYNILSKSKELIFSSEIHNIRMISAPFYISDDEIVFLRGDGQTEIILYNRVKDEITNVTDDGYEKMFIDVSYK